LAAAAADMIEGCRNENAAAYTLTKEPEPENGEPPSGGAVASRLRTPGR
jgi:hypothetical protein